MDQRDVINDKIVGLSKLYKHLVIEHPTGSGKGLRVAKCIAESLSPKKWLVCVPEIAQINNYKQDLIKHGYDYLLTTTIHDVICYASLKNYKKTNYNLHLNECHRMSANRTNIVKSINYDQIISDSATISEEVGDRLWSIEPYKLDKITFDEAIDMKIIPQPTIYLVPINLTLQGLQTYNSICNNLTYWLNIYSANKQEWQKFKMLQIAMQRKRFLSTQKTGKALEIINLLQEQGKRFICFTGSITQTHELGGVKAINSKQSKKENLQIIEDFNNNLTNSIYSCSMAIEGMNFTNMDAGIIVQLDKTQRLPTQKIGRMLRSDNPEVYILYVKDTQDEKYLNEFLINSTIKKEFIKYINSKEIMK